MIKRHNTDLSREELRALAIAFHRHAGSADQFTRSFLMARMLVGGHLRFDMLWRLISEEMSLMESSSAS